MELNLIGQTLGKYRILEEIGRGGMGVVYKAHDTVLDRLVAIKVLAPHLTWDQEFVKRFLHEARSAARIEHPHIVTIYDVAQARGHHFIAMKYLEGRSLAEIIRREGPLPSERVVRILDQIAQALDYAHARRLIHRDVKPGNVIVSPHDHATLTDFGVAKALAGTQLTRSGTMLGTPSYMAPEQVKQQSVGPATDVYALGVVAYEMLGGRPPFEGDTPHVLHAHVYEEPPPLSKVNPKVSPPLGGVIHKALAKEPGKRYGSAGVFVEALEQVIGLREPWVVPKPAPHSGQVPLWPLFGALAAVLIVVVMVFWRVINKPDAQDVATRVAVAATETAAPIATVAATATPTTMLTSTHTPTPMTIPPSSTPVPPTPTPIIIVVTATPAPPTPTPSPSASEHPTVGGHVEVVYTGWDGVWVRRSPGNKGKDDSVDIIATLFPPERYEVIDGPRAKDGLTWWKLKGPFGEGWVAEYSGSGIRLIAPSKPPPKVGGYVEVVYTGWDGIWVRRSPGNKGKDDSVDIIATLFPPERYEVIDGPRAKDGLTWWKLKGPFGEGWVAEYSSSGIRLIAPSEPPR